MWLPFSPDVCRPISCLSVNCDACYFGCVSTKWSNRCGLLFSHDMCRSTSCLNMTCDACHFGCVSTYWCNGCTTSLLSWCVLIYLLSECKLWCLLLWMCVNLLVQWLCDYSSFMMCADLPPVIWITNAMHVRLLLFSPDVCLSTSCLSVNFDACYLPFIFSPVVCQPTSCLSVNCNACYFGCVSTYGCKGCSTTLLSWCVPIYLLSVILATLDVCQISDAIDVWLLFSHDMCRPTFCLNVNCNDCYFECVSTYWCNGWATTRLLSWCVPTNLLSECQLWCLLLWMCIILLMQWMCDYPTFLLMCAYWPPFWMWTGMCHLTDVMDVRLPIFSPDVF